MKPNILSLKKFRSLRSLKFPHLSAGAISISLAFFPNFLVSLSPAWSFEPTAFPALETSNNTSRSFIWSALSSASPSGRNLHTLTFAERNSRAILFGGWDGASLLDDVWSLDAVSGAWKRLNPGGEAVTGRRSHGAVYDPDGNRVIVFGGFRGGFLNDVWALDMNSLSWRELHPSGTLPPARSNQAVLYDSERERLIVFGGFGGTILGDVWALDLNSLTWAELVTTGDAPPPLLDCTAVWDPLEGRALIFGGSDGTLLRNEVWALGLTTLEWKELIPRSNQPPARSGHSAIFDPVHGKMLVFGGLGLTYLNDLWSFDPRRLTWKELSLSSPPDRVNSAATYDPLREQVLLFGGWNGGFLNDVWKLDLVQLSWSQISPSLSFPAARRGASFVRDEEGKAIYMFGGFDGTTYLNELWKLGLDALSWELISPSGTPPSGRELHGALLDRVRNRIVVHGGFNGTTYLGDAWILDMNTLAWRELAQTNAPPGRAGHPIALNELTGAFVLFGGENNSGFLGDLWVGWPGEYTVDWEEKTQVLPYPHARTGHWASYIPSTNSLVVFGGRDGIRLLNDLWSLSLSDFTWSQIVSSGLVPGERSGHAGALTESPDEFLIFGGWAGIHVNDIWAFNIPAKSWRKIDAGGDVPVGSEFVAFAYDTLKARGYLFGGFNGWILGNGYMLYSFSPSPTPIYPTDGSKIGGRTPSFTVSNSLSDGSTLTYFFEIDVMPDFDSPLLVRSPGVYEGLYGKTQWAVPSPLSYNASYYFRVRSYDGMSFSGWRRPIQFSVITSDTTLSPTPPRPSSPTELSLVFETSPTLSVFNSRDIEDTLITYFFEVDAISEFSSPLLQISPGMNQGISKTFWKVDEKLTRNGWYYWRTRAFDGEYFSGWMTPTRFLVFGGAQPPQQISFSGGRKESAIQLAWNADYFPSGTGFDIYRCEDRSGEFIKVNQDAIYSSSVSDEVTFSDGAPLAGLGFYLLLVKSPQGELTLYGPVEESPGPYKDSLSLSPNPFSANVSISFAISKEAHVSIRIYDVKGSLVKTLLDERLSPTSKSIPWDGKDLRGEKAHSGIYVVTLKTGKLSLSRKLALIRQ